MRQLPSFDMTNPENIKSAETADSPSSGVSGKYIAEIVEATLDETPGGSVFVRLSFKMPNGKIYKQSSKHILYADGREGFYVPKMRTLFGLTGARDNVGTDKIKEYEFIDGSSVEREVEVPSYVGLLGKKVGVVLNYYQEYPESLGVNGYTGSPIPTKAEDEDAYNLAKKDVTTVWMPNYEKEAQPVFDFVTFFDPETEKTFAESQDDNLEKPVAVEESLQKVLEKNHKAIQLDNKKLDELRMKKLKANLKKNNMPFDKTMFFGTISNNSNSNDSDLI